MMFIRALILLLALTVIGGFAYPLAVTGLTQAFFPHQANGSLVYEKGKAVGSTLIEQDFKGPGYFYGRPSAAHYDAANSGGSNLGPTNKVLLDRIAQKAAAVRKENGLAANAPVPADLVTASASGLDPDITPAAALLQVPRVARDRKLSTAAVKHLVLSQVQPREFGVLGEPTVNVLELNLALDRMGNRG